MASTGWAGGQAAPQRVVGRVAAFRNPPGLQNKTRPTSEADAPIRTSTAQYIPAEDGRRRPCARGRRSSCAARRRASTPGSDPGRGEARRAPCARQRGSVKDLHRDVPLVRVARRPAARSAACRADAHADSRIHGGRSADSRPRHRCHHRSLQRRQRCAAEAIAVSGARSPGARVRSYRRPPPGIDGRPSRMVDLPSQTFETLRLAERCVLSCRGIHADHCDADGPGRRRSARGLHGFGGGLSDARYCAASSAARSSRARKPLAPMQSSS